MSSRRQKPEDVIEYVYYDEVCTKAAKKRVIARRFGAQYGMPASAAPGERSAYTASRRASSGGPSSGRASSGGASSGRESSGRPSSGGSSRSYVYRPGSAQGGEAVRQRPLKLLLEKVINLIETVEERGRRDERIARERAIALKKFEENKRVLFTALFLILLSGLFLFGAYKLFFVIDEVSVDGSELYTDEEVVGAAGFAEGDNLYSFSAGEAEADITFLCPYIKSAEIDRTIPRSVNIALEDDTAVFYANIWGDCVKLSAGLRVLEVTSLQNAVTDGLTELVLPPVASSVGGRPLTFTEPKDERYIRNVVAEALKSELGANGRITSLDLSDKHNLTLLADGKFSVRMGGEDDCDLKLKLAAKTIASSEFDSERDASIDISSADHAIVRYRSMGFAG